MVEAPVVNPSPSEAYEIPCGHGPLHIHINYDSSGPKEVFVNLPPHGDDIPSLVQLLGIMVSEYLTLGGDPQKVVKHFSSVHSSKRVLLPGGQEVYSAPHGISVALQTHLDKQKNGEFKGGGNA